jgi:tight adherence protein C
MLLLAAVAVVAPFGYLTYAGVARSGRSVAIARRNLTRGLSTTTVEAGSLESRGTGTSALLRVLTPDRSAAVIRRLLEHAGHPAGWTMSRALWAKLALGATTALLGVVHLASGAGPLAWLVVPALAVGAYHLPDAVLWGRGEERQKQIGRELPDILDQMSIAVAAGLGFEGALTRAAANGKGPLAAELTRTLQDIAVGRPRREAYDALVRRTKAVDLKRFVAAINQADAYGIAIADVLRVQAREMRVKRRQRAEEKAMKVPVKVLFPLMVCILPVLFIVILAPAALTIMKAFS